MNQENYTIGPTGYLDRIETRADGTTWAIRYLRDGLMVETLLPYGVQPVGGYTDGEVRVLRGHT